MVFQWVALVRRRHPSIQPVNRISDAYFRNVVYMSSDRASGTIDECEIGKLVNCDFGKKQTT